MTMNPPGFRYTTRFDAALQAIGGDPLGRRNSTVFDAAGVRTRSEGNGIRRRRMAMVVAAVFRGGAPAGPNLRAVGIHVSFERDEHCGRRGIALGVAPPSYHDPSRAPPRVALSAQNSRPC
jgi:hypothetical protein